MSNNTRHTKSKFKIALECPTQLYYHQNPELNDNQSDYNPFLEALDKGGFQVGELAKYLFPTAIFRCRKGKASVLLRKFAALLRIRHDGDGDISRGI